MMCCTGRGKHDVSSFLSASNPVLSFAADSFWNPEDRIIGCGPKPPSADKTHRSLQAAAVSSEAPGVTASHSSSSQAIPTSSPRAGDAKSTVPSPKLQEFRETAVDGDTDKAATPTDIVRTMCSLLKLASTQALAPSTDVAHILCSTPELLEPQELPTNTQHLQEQPQELSTNAQRSQVPDPPMAEVAPLSLSKVCDSKKAPVKSNVNSISNLVNDLACRFQRQGYKKETGESATAGLDLKRSRTFESAPLEAKLAIRMEQQLLKEKSGVCRIELSRLTRPRHGIAIVEKPWSAYSCNRG